MADINYILLMITAVIMALAYGLIGFFADKVNNGGSFNLPKLLATVVYSIIVGVIAVNTGVITLQNIGDYQTVFSPVWVMYGGVYLGLIYVFSKVVVPIFDRATTTTKFYARKAAAAFGRKMDPESRNFLVFDLPEWSKQLTLNCVDAAEAQSCFQYAIESGNWIFLIENGELTGAKHYWARFWKGQSVQWKPITPECLETCRKTGRIPDFTDLY